MPNSFLYDLCDATEIYFIIYQLQSIKASGPNDFPTKILQMIRREMWNIH